MVKKKVLILGGGMGALSTAYWLSHNQTQRDAYDVTVVSNGWRLGGKLASGRDQTPPYASYEHGLHVWFGFYDNAFALLRHLYDRWNMPASCPFRTWDAVVRPQSYTPVGGSVYGVEAFLDVPWPINDATPGEGGLWPTPWQYLVEALSLVENAVEWWFTHQAGISLDAATITSAEENALKAVGVKAASRSARDLLRTAVVLSKGLLDDNLEVAIRKDIAKLVDFALAAVQLAIKPFVDALTVNDVDAKDGWCILSVGTAFFRGICNPNDDIVVDGNLDRVDYLEYRDWLKQNGGGGAVVDHWRGVRSLYDCCFQYTDGDPTKPNFAAGTAARIMLRIITQYKGACLYLFNCGVGEGVIAPAYEVCKDQGVKFTFFTEVKHLKLDATHQNIEKVTLHKQVDLALGVPEYVPLFETNGLRCWPREPFWAQLDNGAAWQAAGVDFESPWGVKPPGSDYDVTVGVDFDIVVLATSLGAFKIVNGVDPSFVEELINDDPQWKKMCETTGLAPSVGLQLWMKPNLHDLGWTRGKPAMVGFTYPGAVWADMTQVIESEMWPDPTAPKSLHYFCGNLGTTLYQAPKSDPTVPNQAKIVALNATTAQFQSPNGTKAIWPNVMDGTGGIDPAQIALSYLRANVAPTECCEGTPFGASQYKMAADKSGYKNLFLAGAWIRTGINSSCVEGAVMSGMQCSRAISGEPAVVVGEDFMHVFPGGHPSRNLPLYLSRLGHGENSVEPPGIVKGAKTWAWVVKGNQAAMQHTVDQFLNAAGGDEVGYTVLGDFCLMSFLDGAALTSLVEVMGNVADREVSFWIPLLQKKRGELLPTLKLWMPYVVVDTSVAAITGRESWGYLKEVGSLKFPNDVPAQKTFEASAMTFLNFSTTEVGQVRPLITVKKPGGTAGGSSGAVIAVAADIIAQFLAMGFTLAHATQLVNVGVPLINVKQFRDARRPTRAAYQALVENDCSPVAIYGGYIVEPGHKLDILNCASHQIVQDLGLPSYTDIPIDLGFMINMDFSVTNGDEVYRRTP